MSLVRRKKSGVVVMRARGCRRCRRLLPAGTLVCEHCGGYVLVPIKCRVDRRDLDDLFFSFPSQFWHWNHYTWYPRRRYYSIW